MSYIENNVPGKILYFQLFFLPCSNYMKELHGLITQLLFLLQSFFSKCASPAMAFLAQMVQGRQADHGRVCDDGRALELWLIILQYLWLCDINDQT